MWVERVTARAFGPFRDAELELGPGLTVVSGPNEAGKSSWHAALRLALTGMRRGKGGRTVEARETEERHRPWDDAEGAWEVAARLHLDDGRTIDISQDLAGRVDCRAWDVGLGRDVSSEIIVDGSPDASRWLGLDRQAFAATVSVDQAQILAVVDAAEGLQDDMQRAAASAGRDATAAEALTHLTDFRRTAVGANTRVAVGPLRQAHVAVESAESDLAAARLQHAEHFSLLARAQAAAAAVAVARRHLEHAEAVAEQSRVGALVAASERAHELAARHPTPPPAMAGAEEDAARVADALAAWRGRPTVNVPPGADSAEIERQLADLPPPPDGDVAPHPSVLAALRDLDQAEGAATALAPGSAPRPASEPTPAAMPAARWLVVGGLALAVAGLAAWVLNAAALGVLLVVAGLALAGWGVLGRRTTAAPAPTDWADRQHSADARLATAAAELRAALTARGQVTGPGDDLRAAVDAYAAACAARAEEAASAASAEPLRQQLATRRQLEDAAARAAATTERAYADLVAVAAQVGLGTDGRPPETIVAALEAWQSNREQERRVAGQAIAEWQELTDLLAGRSLDALAAEARDGTRRLAAAGLALPTATSDGRTPSGGPGPADDHASAVEAARSALLAAERDAAAVGAQADQLAASLPSVAEAEERQAGAHLELQRVTGLAAIVDRTIELLETAQEQVHRDLAPILADAVRSWLPRVSDGAYLDVAVDPADLKVQVKEAATGRWRDARRLSAGTREQIYLLLRVAMAQHLVTTDEAAPLLLDEVTAQADDRRREQLLDVLAELSRDRQVVLFTHDPRIADWAEARQTKERDRVIRLSGRQAAVA